MDHYLWVVLIVVWAGWMLLRGGGGG